MTKRAKIITASAVTAVLIITLAIWLTLHFVLGENKFKYVARASGLSKFSHETRESVNNANYYISTIGSDESVGNIDAPFRTIEHAQNVIRQDIKAGRVSGTGITVAIFGGEYTTMGLKFNSEDSIDGKTVKYTAYNNEEVTINGGIKLDGNKFTKVEGDVKARLNSSIADNVYGVNLADYGITADNLGKLYSVGAFTTSDKYDGDHTGANAAEIFYNNKRMDSARYPNKGKTLDIRKVNDVGDCYEPKPQDYRKEWLTMRNPRGGTFRMDTKTNERVQSWQTLDDVWVFGYFYWDWADMSSTIKTYDSANGSLTMDYSSRYGYKKGADYYFYNVLEELDAPGEYYLDRETLHLYLYPEADIDQADITLSLATDNIISVENDGKNIVFDGLTLLSGRKSGISVDGENVLITNCVIKNVAENGVVIKGKNNMISRSEVMHIGQNAIWLGSDILDTNGEDIRKDELITENNIADNCSLHDFGELQRTYISGVSIHGVGNIASHNEIYNAPHMGIFYEGNDHIMEYNYLHDVVSNSTDAGAIYAGRNLSYYGNIIRYNCIDTIGGGKFTPDGIYFDDGLSGQTAYGNLLVNIPKIGILIGGGRDNNVYNNLIINAKTPIHYDARLYEGYNGDGWYKAHVKETSGNHWKLYDNAKMLNEMWGNKYPEITATHNSATKSRENSFFLNPNSRVVGNIMLSTGGTIGYTADAVLEYATYQNNGVYKLTDIGFNDYGAGDYRLNGNGGVKGFQPIPISLIGRY